MKIFVAIRAGMNLLWVQAKFLWEEEFASRTSYQLVQQISIKGVFTKSDNKSEESVHMSLQTIDDQSLPLQMKVSKNCGCTFLLTKIMS